VLQRLTRLISTTRRMVRDNSRVDISRVSRCNTSAIGLSSAYLVLDLDYLTLGETEGQQVGTLGYLGSRLNE
jgi:hypothetical protein